MSNWTMDEVNELLDANHGGNRAAQHIWLGNAPAIGGRYAGGARPKAGDRVDIFKQFILDAYEHGKFKASTPYQPSDGTSSSASSGPSPVNSAPVSPKPPSSRPPSVLPPAAPAPSLLDDDLFSSTPSSFSQPGSAKSNNGGFTPPPNFDPFASSAPTNVSSGAADFDPFTPTRATASSAAAFDPFATAPAPTSAKTTNNAASLNSMFSDMSFAPSAPAPAATAAPTTSMRPPSIQQPAATTAPAFDPFGDTLLVPVSNNSPPPTSANNHSSFSFVNNQPSQSARGAANPGSILDLYNTPNSGNNGVMQSGYRPNAGAASAISSLDVFGSAPGPRPMMPMGQPQPMMNRGMAPGPMAPMSGGYGMGGGMGGMGGLPPNSMMGGPMGGSAMGAMNNNSIGISSMGGMGARPMMNNGMGGGMGGGMMNNGMNRGGNNGSNNNLNSFDFVQDNMKMHLNSSGRR